jgi:hypothetical protein
VKTDNNPFLLLHAITQNTVLMFELHRVRIIPVILTGCLTFSDHYK